MKISTTKKRGLRIARYGAPAMQTAVLTVDESVKVFSLQETGQYLRRVSMPITDAAHGTLHSE
ncbi:MAG: hypothetical protein E6L07_01870 [Verrucomicrobia bacterium]|nr:MAG: hypothetical protein E6L07_01870 [Verrucomicrobiota bacterium]